MLEIEAEAIANELRSPGPNGESPAGIKDSVIDKDGFPRADIDIYRVRAQRSRLAIINTDHKALMKQLETELHKAHSQLSSVGDSSAAPSTTSSASASTAPPQPSQEITYENVPAFALFDEILPDSPAAQAGLEDQDNVVAFGPVSFKFSCHSRGTQYTPTPLNTRPRLIFLLNFFFLHL